MGDINGKNASASLYIIIPLERRGSCVHAVMLPWYYYRVETPMA
jgi:hypothetical protein